ncbi:MAG: hypothetical protein KC933_29870 [Myxococcales bacterium]|nr:hypothetical protein [Myxococcales bacterium]
MKLRPIIPWVLLCTACGAPTEELAPPGAEFGADSLPQDAIFGAALDLEGDLLAVVAEAPLLQPAPDEWTGAVLFYRRDGDVWRLEDQQAVPASWLIEPAVHIVGGRVMVVSPTDGRCLDPRGVPRAQSGSVYVYEGGPGGWALTAHVCAPDPQTGFGWASVVADGALIVESTLQYGRLPGVLARVLGDGGAWHAEPVADVAWAALASGVAAADDRRLVRVEQWGEAWSMEVRALDDLQEVERRLPCPDGQGRCLPALSASGVLVGMGPTLVHARDDGATDTFELVGAGLLRQLTAEGDLAVALSEGRLYTVRLDDTPGPVAPAVTPCPDGVTSVALTTSALVLTCAREHRGWVLPLPGD